MSEHLSDNFYRAPSDASEIMGTKRLKEILLNSNGFVMACGRSWDIKSKPCGPGVHKVWLELRTYGPANRGRREALLRRTAKLLANFYGDPNKVAPEHVEECRVADSLLHDIRTELGETPTTGKGKS